MKSTKSNKVYKDKNNNNDSMLHGDPQGSPDESFSSQTKETFIFIDDGFLAKLNKSTAENQK